MTERNDINPTIASWAQVLDSSFKLDAWGGSSFQMPPSQYQNESVKSTEPEKPEESEETAQKAGPNNPWGLSNINLDFDYSYFYYGFCLIKIYWAQVQIDLGASIRISVAASADLWGDKFALETTLLHWILYAGAKTGSEIARESITVSEMATDLAKTQIDINDMEATLNQLTSNIDDTVIYADRSEANLDTIEAKVSEAADIMVYQQANAAKALALTQYRRIKARNRDIGHTHGKVAANRVDLIGTDMNNIAVSVKNNQLVSELGRQHVISALTIMQNQANTQNN